MAFAGAWAGGGVDLLPSVIAAGSTGGAGGGGGKVLDPLLRPAASVG